MSLKPYLESVQNKKLEFKSYDEFEKWLSHYRGSKQDPIEITIPNDWGEKITYKTPFEALESEEEGMTPRQVFQDVIANKKLKTHEDKISAFMDALYDGEGVSKEECIELASKYFKVQKGWIKDRFFNWSKNK